jgi:hypothetical protein
MVLPPWGRISRGKKMSADKVFVLQTTDNPGQAFLEFNEEFGKIDILLLDMNGEIEYEGSPANATIHASMPWSQAGWDALLASFRQFRDEDGVPFTFFDGEGSISDGVFFAESMEEPGVPEDALYKAILWASPNDPDFIVQFAQVWEDKIFFLVFLGGHEESTWWAEYQGKTSWKRETMSSDVGFRKIGDTFKIGVFG